MKATSKKYLRLIWVVLLILIAVFVLANWIDISEGFKDGYNSAPK